MYRAFKRKDFIFNGLLKIWASFKKMGFFLLPLTAITWYKDNRPLSGSNSVTFLNRGQVIDIENAQIVDAGIYKCVAINSAGATELFYSLQVHGKCWFS